ncbi:MAG: hypothetical protein COA46_03560 [Porticoccaceae bacterium]|nr:MAG: hypothetical protein COA46_03560 [Porticoccaceae bacterium]
MKAKLTSLGTTEHIAIFLAYILGWISGLIILLIEKNNDRVRYHAAQSFIVFGSITIINLLIPIIPFFSFSILLTSILSIITLGIWITFIVTTLNKKPIEIEQIRTHTEQIKNFFSS